MNKNKTAREKGHYIISNHVLTNKYAERPGKRGVWAIGLCVNLGMRGPQYLSLRKVFRFILCSRSHET